jgi:Tfp pilus assembly protein PilF
LLLGFIGCASSGRKHVQKLAIPPGLDSTTVVRSNDIANKNFVSTPREKKADELAQLGKKELEKVDEFWAYLEQDIKQNKSLTSEQKEQFDREYNLGAEYLGRYKAMSGNGTNDAKTKQAQDFCQQAKIHLENAAKINPFDKNARALLAITYYNLQHMFGLDKNYERAIEILERLTRIEKGEHELFRLLAENYLALKNFEKALQNLQKGQTILLKTSFEAPPDTSLLFYYMYAQGDVYARMHEAVSSLKAFQVADKFARTEQEKADVKNYLKWINWDGGNIRASEAWDKILNLEAAKDFEKTAKACEQLIPNLKTSRAKFSVFHKLAVIEFEILGRKAQAVERMRQMYETLADGDFKTRKEELQPFLNSYGAMLYRLGVEARDKQEKKLALAYFNKASSFEWDQVPKAYMELVTLLWNDPEQAIKYGKLALAKNDLLSSQESTELLSLMVRAHKSAGLYDEARIFFEKWKQKQEPTDAKNN